MRATRLTNRLTVAAFVLIPCLAAPARGDSSPQEAPRTGIELEFVDSDTHSFTDEERRAIEIMSAEALRDIAALIDVPPRIELVVQAGDAVIPDTGEGGMALAPGRLGWTVDPDRYGGVVSIARARLRATLFHEIHHLVRGWTVEGGTAGRRMIDAVVSEGLATAFERDAAGLEPPWGVYPTDEVAGWVDELLAVEGFAEYATWMFQHPDGRRWIGYRAGTYIADEAMRASGRSAADLVATPTDEVLALAGIR